jgi:hypothetical protein
MSERSRHRRIVRVPEPQVPTGDSGLASDRAPTNDEPSVPRPDSSCAYSTSRGLLLADAVDGPRLARRKGKRDGKEE